MKAQAGQNARKDISRTYVAVKPGADVVEGYYSISSHSIRFVELPRHLAKRLPKYPVPTVLIGRLAVDLRSQGQGLGRMLLFDACRRVCGLADQLGIHALVVHALDDKAREFYIDHGFMELLGNPHHLFLPVATIRKAMPG